MADNKITYLGHSTFLIQSIDKKNILIDPWLDGNPRCPEKFNQTNKLPKIDCMLITHGHYDHVADAVKVGKKFSCASLANFEIGTWLESKGVKNVHPMNKGGTLAVPGHEKIKVTQCNAFHSSMIQDDDKWIYGGEACSFIIQLENGYKIYHAGDTCIFGDMKLIGDLYQPDIALLPIGDRFTMGPKDAAKACNLLGIKKVIPMHYATFPLLTGTPSQFQKELQGSGVEMHELKPGESI